MSISMFIPPEDKSFSEKRFLIVDDFAGMRGILRDILRSCHADTKLIDTATTGKETLTLLEKNKYDVVLCDFNLGQGKNGQQVLEEARVRQLIGPSCTWIMITAEKTTDVVMGASEYQPDIYLLKPVTEAMLRLRLTKIWAKKEAFTEISAKFAQKDFLGAIKLCDKRLVFDKANAVELLKLKTQLLLSCGKTDEARAVFSEVATERNLPWAKVGLAKLLMQDGDHKGAAALLESVVTENRSYLDAYDWLAQAYQSMELHEEAEQVLERATRLSPNSVIRQKVLGDVSLKLGKLDNAEKAFRKSMTLGEHSAFNSPDSYLGLAKTYSAKDNHGDALRTLVTLNKNFEDKETRLKSLIAEGVVHHKSGDPIAARKIAQQLVQQMEEAPQPVDSASNLEMAQLMLVTGEKDAALNRLQQEVKNNPENTRILDQVKEVFAVANMTEQGDAMVEETRKASVEQMNSGVLLVREGKYDEAIAAMRAARTTMPGNTRLLFNLAYVLIVRLQKVGLDAALVTEARDVLLEANRLSPGEKRYGQLMTALESLPALH